MYFIFIKNFDSQIFLHIKAGSSESTLGCQLKKKIYGKIIYLHEVEVYNHI